MKRKKQGASLIIVVIIFMFVFSVSTAMLSMVASNYKARAAESKRIENLYASDSGLDVAYTIIGKTFDAASKYANFKVKKMQSLTYESIDDGTSIYNQDYIDIQKDIKELEDDIETLNNWNEDHKDTPAEQRAESDIERDIAKKKALMKEDENVKETLCNEEFKRAFKNFIIEYKSKDEDAKYDEEEDDNHDRLGRSEDAPNELKDLIKDHKYVSTITGIDSYTKETIDFAINNKNNEPPQLEAEVNESLVEHSYKSIGISESDGHHKSVSFTVYGKQFYDISVTSTFYTEKVKKNEEEKEVNQRQLKATYKMLVPDYKDIYFINSSGDLNQYLATKDRALTIMGDMNVNNVDGLTVDGEIFVQGSPNDDKITDDRVYGKYFGGISLKNSDNILFTENVITRGTFNIENTTTSASAKIATLDKNLYARNVYVGKIEDDGNGLASGVSVLNVGNKNEYNSNKDKDKWQVIVNNDLALNANNVTINMKDFYGIGEENVAQKAQSSSSIIVNGNNNSQIDIANSAYLMGTAHIATLGDYQTAESGAVKGNYIAYSVPLHEADRFGYYNPLQLLEADQNDKEKHFTEYWSKEGNNANSGGIHWPIEEDDNITTNNNIFSAGVLIYETSEDVDISGERQKKRVVIPSHYNADLFEDDGKVGKKRIQFAQYAYKFGQYADMNDYNKPRVTNFTSLIDTSQIPSTYRLSDQEGKGEYAIFNGYDSKEIKITTGSENMIDTSDDKVIKIQVGKDADNKYVLNAVIATAGKVSIESGIIINGCIIAKGDLDINGDNVTIKYDSGVIERVQAQNFDTFKAVFGESIVDDSDTTGTDNDSTPASDGAASYELKNFLENKLWKILK